MGKHSRLLPLRLLAIALMCSGVSMAAEITGQIHQADGTPLAGATIQLGDLEIGEAAMLTGRLHLTDGGTFPEGTRIHIERRRAWDSLVVDVSPDGHFEAKGIPLAEAFSLSIPPDHEV